MISGIILASGLSRRMGRDKLLLTLGEVPVIERVIAAAAKSELGEVILVCSSDKVAEIGKKYRVKIVANNNPETGQSNSIKLGVAKSNPCTEGFMFLVGDQPFIDESVIDSMIASFAAGNCGAAVPLYNGVRGNPVIFAARLREKLLGLSGDTGGRVLLKEMEADIVTVSFQHDKSGLDIDTMEEYQAVLRRED